MYVSAFHFIRPRERTPFARARQFRSSTRSRGSLFAALALLVAACAAPGADGELGQLELGLTTQSGGVTYRLTGARFALEGPSSREFAAGEEEQVALELPAGAYRLTLLEGFQLARMDDPAAPPVSARLISQNPAPVLIRASETARIVFRFELAGGESVDLGPGTLQVGIEIGSADAGAGGASDCALGLRINEFDYEQAGTDEGEFIELLNAGECAAALADLTLELVNGNDGKVYGHYALAEVAPSLEPGQRLVLGDANVLAALPSGVPSVALNASGLQNGPDGLRIVTGERVIDAVAYGGEVMGASEGGFTVADEGESALARCPDGFDTGDGAVDFRLAAPSPGAPNSCS